MIRPKTTSGLRGAMAIVALLLLALVIGSGTAAAFTLDVVDENGVPVSGFRWLVEDDNTVPAVPGVQAADSLSLNIHASHAPVVASGHESGSSASISVPADRPYMVSVLPDNGHAMGGINVESGQASATVVVHSQPIQTAQISVFVFHDNQPVNNAPDIPAEAGLEGFSVVLADPAGQTMMDAYGNMIGTTYQENPDGSLVYDVDGNPIMTAMGPGYVLTNASGEALIKYLAPGKYGVHAIRPQGTDWVQTATIEGTKTVDAWVKAGEPPYFTEWGFFEWHVFIGFIEPMTIPPSPEGTGTIIGQVVNVHQTRPPQPPGLEPGNPVSGAWVALNDLDDMDNQIYAQPCDPEDGSFSIDNVPPGMYQLAIFDEPLDSIIDFRTVLVPPEGGTVDMEQVAIYRWFGTVEGKVFLDLNEDGYPDADEPGILEQNVILRFRDGTVYQAQPTDINGEYALEEVFPFFKWLVVEVDFARFKATGATFVVDDGGPLAPGMKNNPQPQPENGGLGYRTETGPVLTQAMMLFADQTNELHFGKAAYAPGENGGISGIVYYATTRAEDDPRFAAGEEWEPGIPRVQVNLYTDADNDQLIDDLDLDGQVTPCDVDNHPLGNFPGDEDTDWNGNLAFDLGDAIDVTWTDSWDDSPPSGVVGPGFSVHGQPVMDGAETYRNWNQVRPGVFDGGYAFDGMPSGLYIVEAATPPGYELVKEEDRNVDFGDSYETSGIVTPPPACVGEDHTVPAFMSLFPDLDAPYAGEVRKLCNRKQVALTSGQNTAADFFFFTAVPKAARIVGMALNDVLLEFDPDSPQKGTNYGVPWIPVAIRDAWGNELARVYTDEWGFYNALVPSTFTVNLPIPTGVAPNMISVCLNDPGPIPDPDNPGQMILDPAYNPVYGQISTQWDLWPGKTTYTDTPILPIGAFASSRSPLDVEFPAHTPVVSEVNGPGGGPYVSAAGETITITALGDREVPNPDYDPDVPGSPYTVTRDYGFGDGPAGAPGYRVRVGNTNLQIVSWSSTSITAEVPPGTNTGQLTVRRGDNGRSSLLGITLHVGAASVAHVYPGQSIQEAIDAAPDTGGALILVHPGVYRENPIMWKDVMLQGTGAFSTTILAGPMLPDEQAAWETRLENLIDGGQIELIPGEQPDFALETGAGIFVGASDGQFTEFAPAMIDGFTVSGAIRGGAIFVNAYARHLKIGNNRLVSNQGNFGGAVRVGTPSLVNEGTGGYYGSANEGIEIHNNQIITNGAVDGGGGIALFKGADDYRITDNWICGNFTLLYGGGIAHYGLSPWGRISGNLVLFNEAFDEGGGILVGGELVPAGAPAGTLTEGAGPVSINANWVQGNMSGDDGGGIRTINFNGQDVVASPLNASNWYYLLVLNNMIVNNVTADSGGGISLDDTARLAICNNTIAYNDSTATGVDAFGGPCDEGIPGNHCCEECGIGGLTSSQPQVAGIGARGHSQGLLDASPLTAAQEFSNPYLYDNIIWRNRAFYWDAEAGDFGEVVPDDDPYWDLWVYGTSAPKYLKPRYCVLTDNTGYGPTNFSTGDVEFLSAYANSFLATSKGSAFGNFVQVSFEPLGLRGNYHIQPTSIAVDNGNGTLYNRLAQLHHDFDGQARPMGGGIDIGADETQ